MTISTSSIHKYLDRYTTTLTHYDAEGAAELWSIPGMIVDDRFSGVLESRDSLIEGLQQSYPLYQQLGLQSVGYELHEEKHLTDGLVLVKVRWLFYDSTGDLLTDSNAYYLLRAEEPGIRATVCVQTDDAEKLQTLAADKGIDLTPPSD